MLLMFCLYYIMEGFKLSAIIPKKQNIVTEHSDQSKQTQDSTMNQSDDSKIIYVNGVKGVAIVF